MATYIKMKAFDLADQIRFEIATQELVQLLLFAFYLTYTLSNKDKLYNSFRSFDFFNRFIYISFKISGKVMNAAQDLWSMEHEDKAMADMEKPEEKTPDLDYRPCSDSFSTSPFVAGSSTTDVTDKIKVVYDSDSD